MDKDVARTLGELEQKLHELERTLSDLSREAPLREQPPRDDRREPILAHEPLLGQEPDTDRETSPAAHDFGSGSGSSGRGCSRAGSGTCGASAVDSVVFQPAHSKRAASRPPSYLCVVSFAAVAAR